MTRLADIEARLASLGELLEIVGAMRSLAGARMQEAQRVLPGARRYAQAVSAGIADTLLLAREPLAPEPVAGPLGLVLCTAEHGFVGGFNERLLSAAQETLAPGDQLFVLGTRGAALAFERGSPPAWSGAMPSRCSAVPESIQRLTEEIYRRIAHGALGRVAVIHARYGGIGTAAVARRVLLPLDPAALAPRQSRQAPLHNLDPVALHERLMAQYVFALLTEAAVESIACENAARLAAMTSARESLRGKLEQLGHSAEQARQNEITTEILDLVTGIQALASRRPARRSSTRNETLALDHGRHPGDSV